MRRLIIPLFIVCAAVVLLVVFMPNLGSANPDVMSFNEAIDAVSLGNSNIQSFSYSKTRELEHAAFVDERGIRGFLVWLAPNGTYYQVEYPSERILGKIAEAFSSGYNPPNGYTFWWLNYGDGEAYWVNASNGSIIFHLPARGGGPSKPNDISPIINTSLFVVIPAVVIVAVAAAAAFTFKRKTNKKSTKANLYSPREILFCS